MTKVFVLLFVVIAFVQCDRDSDDSCSVPATVRNITGLDGCEWVFELQDSTKLDPFWNQSFCGFSEDVEEDPLHDFEFVDGKKVFIDYEIMHDLANACMVGPVVKITCISEAALISEE